MWKEVSADRYDAMLGVLPPALQTGIGFLVGEPFDHRRCSVTGDIRASYAAFIEHREKYYEGPHLTVPEFRTVDLQKVVETAGSA